MSDEMNNALIIRADADCKIGSGHVMRCLALAQSFQDFGGKIIFIMAMDAGSLFKKLENENIEVKKIEAVPGSLDDAQKTFSIASEAGTEWIVLDGYHFSAEYQKKIRSTGFKVLFIDDNCEQEHYYADIILNQNIHASGELYPQMVLEPYTTLLLGLKYCLLRREFLSKKDFKRDIPEKAEKILITMGGSDSSNVTCKVLEALKAVDNPELRVKVVVGGNNPHYNTIQTLVKTLNFSCAVIYDAVDKQMADAMTWADFAITACGSTVWELCLMKLPFAAVVTAENQQGIAGYLKNRLENVIFTSIDDLFTEKIHDLLVDFSHTRMGFAQLFESIGGVDTSVVSYLLPANAIRLKRVREKDYKTLWEWANEPDVRRNAFSTESIPWEDHLKWIEKKISDDSCLMYIAYDKDNNKIGQIRFDCEENYAIIDVSISPFYRNHGFGRKLINLGIKKLFAEIKIPSAVAIIKNINKASIAAFSRAGFQLEEQKDIQGVPCSVMRINK